MTELVKTLSYKLINEGFIKFNRLIDGEFCLRYVSMQWKMAEIMMFPKPGKSPNDKTPYLPVSLLPIICEIVENLLIKRFSPTQETSLILNSQTQK